MDSHLPLETFRRQCRPNSRFTHLNNAGIAPICLPALHALNAWAERVHTDGTFAIPDLFAAQEQTRSSLARLLGAAPEQIAFFQGAANAISQMAFGLDFRAGDEVLVWDQEYPSNFYPWRDAVQRAGGRLVVASSGPHLSTPLENLLTQVTPRTRVIAISWVQYQTGAITDLKDLASFARAKGILTCADVIQGAGALPLDFQDSGLDAIVGGSHKWLLSPLGVGFLCARHEVLERLKPQAVGAMTYGTSEDLAHLGATLRASPSRFEPGSRPLLDIAAFGAALDLFLQTGMDVIAQEAEWLAKKLMHGLRERGYEIQSPHGQFHRGAIVNFRPTSVSAHPSLEGLEAALRAAGVACARRAGGIRLSPHAFNTQDDLEVVFQAVATSVP
ncbi:MAG: aminotransferase class V-fold PLP-dependent enzyme [Bdellovibrionaceae bacterium]|nr:aminotransferase class V-fold PLP-dependent enzyme [Pseudobdellovibrionaceae bacterium]